MRLYALFLVLVAALPMGRASAQSIGITPNVPEISDVHAAFEYFTLVKALPPAAAAQKINDTAAAITASKATFVDYSLLMDGASTGLVADRHLSSLASRLCDTTFWVSPEGTVTETGASEIGLDVSTWCAVSAGELLAILVHEVVHFDQGMDGGVDDGLDPSLRNLIAEIQSLKDEIEAIRIEKLSIESLYGLQLIPPETYCEALRSTSQSAASYQGKATRIQGQLDDFDAGLTANASSELCGIMDELASLAFWIDECIWSNC